MANNIISPEDAARLRANGKPFHIRQQVELLIYYLIPHFDSEHATDEEITARNLRFQVLDILLGRNSNAPEYTALTQQENSKVVRPYECRPPPD
jgi:hypothetical protein